MRSATLPELTGLDTHLALPRPQGGKGKKLTTEQRERLAARTQADPGPAPAKRMYQLRQVPVKVQVHQGQPPRPSQPQVKFSLPGTSQEVDQPLQNPGDLEVTMVPYNPVSALEVHM